MKISNYFQFIKEDVSQDLISKLSDENKDIKTDILEMITKSVNSKDPKMITEFIDSIIRNTEDSKIEGLISDADIYEFYEKYTNQVDEILSKIKFYDTKPSEINSFSLYKFVVKGTQKAILDLVSDIKGEIIGQGGEKKPE
jgi:hypothetical protein